jgi:hypothetical protein
LAARLVNHYQRLGRKADSERIVVASGQAVERRSASANHTVAHFWLDQVFRFYLVNRLDPVAERIQILARQRGEKAEGETKAVAVEVEIPPDELEKFLSGITEGGLDQKLTNIAGYLEQLFYRVLDAFRKKVLIAFAHGLGLVADYSIDVALINALGSQD